MMEKDMGPSFFDILVYQRKEFLSNVETKVSYGNVDYDISTFTFFSNLSLFGLDDKIQLRLGVTVHHNEVKLYLIDNEKSSHIYLTIYEIYKLLNSANNKDEIAETIKKFINKNDMKENYVQLGNVKHTVYLPDVKKYNNQFVTCDKSGHIYDLSSVLLLLFMIQYKSNYYCNKSREKKQLEKIDGIVRLMEVLISINNGDKRLTARGWNLHGDHYEFENVLKYSAIVLKLNKVPCELYKKLTLLVERSEVMPFINECLKFVYGEHSKLVPDLTKTSLNLVMRRTKFQYLSNGKGAEMCKFIERRVRFKFYKISGEDKTIKFRYASIDKYIFTLKGIPYLIFSFGKHDLSKYYLTKKEYDDIIGLNRP